MPAIFFAVSNLVQSSRYQAGVIWLQSSQSISRYMHLHGCTGAKLVRQVARGKQQHGTWVTFYENKNISY